MTTAHNDIGPSCQCVRLIPSGAIVVSNLASDGIVHNGEQQVRCERLIDAIEDADLHCFIALSVVAEAANEDAPRRRRAVMQGTKCFYDCHARQAEINHHDVGPELGH
jgi:hypothetical protein